jgi:hypothetical protein
LNFFDLTAHPGHDTFTRKKAMKRLLTYLFPLLCLPSFAQQDAFLDINNIKANVNASGDLFYNINTLASMLFAPQNSSSNITFSGANLWIGGLDAGGQLRIAAQTYRQGGTDFWPGPLDTNSASITSTASMAWNKVWKVNKSTIDSFKLGLFSAVPASIANWPAHGDAQYGQHYFLAPFHDANGNMTYDPSNGDYPIIRGNQAVYFIFNDNQQGSAHGTGGGALGIEVHGMAYAFNCPSDSAFANTIFFHYKIINRSTFQYNSVYAGTWMDIDIGNYADDKAGTDSTLSLCYFYDSGTDAIGMSWLSPRLDKAMCSSNNFTATGNPSSAAAHYYYLTGLWADGTPLTYGGTGYGGNAPASFPFTGDPVTATGWLDPSSDDKRAIGSSGPYTFAPGGVIEFDVAFTFARKYSSGNIQCVNQLKQRVQSIQSAFSNNVTPCGGIFFTGIQEQVAPVSAIAYPNPFDHAVTIEVNTDAPYSISIIDQLGRVVKKINDINTRHITVEKGNLPTGIYFYRIETAGGAACGKLIIR